MIACRRYFLNPQDHDWRAGPSLFDDLPIMGEHRLDAAPGIANDNGITLMQGAVLDQQGRSDTPEFVQFGLNDGADALPLRVRFELFHFGNDEDIF